MATQFSVKDNRKWKVPFFTIWTGQALSLLGSQLVSFALVWYLTVETGSATVLAMASLVGIIPGVVLGPLIGPLVDRWNRRVTMIVADSVVAIATLVLAVLFAIGEVAIWQIYLLMFVRSLAGGFHGPSMIASTSLIVPVENLTRIQGINQMLNGGLNVVSAPLGALMLELLPLQGILMIDVVSALFAIVPLFFISVPEPDRSQGKELAGEKSSLWGEMMAGIRYVISWPGLLIVLLMATLLNFLLNPAFSLFPLLVKEHFGKGALELGYWEGLFGIGVIAGGLLLGIWGGFKRRILTTMAGLFGIGLGTASLGLMPPDGYTWALVASVVLGVSQPITNGSLMGIVQAKVAPDMQGRVFTLTGTLAGGMSPIGLIIAGPLSDKFGVQTWFILGGITCIVLAVSGLMIPAVMKIENNQNGGQQELEESVGIEQAVAAK